MATLLVLGLMFNGREFTKLDISTKAQQLADSVVESSEYQNLKEARDNIENHQAAKIMLRDFQRKQLNLQKKQMDGNPITEEDTKELNKLYEVLHINPYIRELLEAEFAFHELMNKIQEILSEAINIAPIETEEDLEDKSPAQDMTNPAKKLWTPGN